eukprot:PhF_6_TR1925/c0_g1_i1/m.2982
MHDVSSGRLFLVDKERLLVVSDSSGMVVLLFAVPAATPMLGLTVYNSKLFYTLTSSNAIYVADRITGSNLIFAGTVQGTGTGSQVAFTGPQTLRTDAWRKRIYIAEKENHKVRYLQLSSYIISAAGLAMGTGQSAVQTGQTVLAPDTINVNAPYAMAVSPSTLYVSTSSHVVIALGLTVYPSNPNNLPGGATATVTHRFDAPKAGLYKTYLGRAGETNPCNLNKFPSSEVAMAGILALVYDQISRSFIWSEDYNVINSASVSGISQITTLVGKCGASDGQTTGTQSASNPVGVGQATLLAVVAEWTSSNYLLYVDAGKKYVKQVLKTTSAVTIFAGTGATMTTYAANTLLQVQAFSSISAMEVIKKNTVVLLISGPTPPVRGVVCSRVTLMSYTYWANSQAEIKGVGYLKGYLYVTLPTSKALYWTQYLNPNLVIFTGSANTADVFSAPGAFTIHCRRKSIFIYDTPKIKEVSLTTRAAAVISGANAGAGDAVISGSADALFITSLLAPIAVESAVYIGATDTYARIVGVGISPATTMASEYGCAYGSGSHTPSKLMTYTPPPAGQASLWIGMSTLGAGCATGLRPSIAAPAVTASGLAIDITNGVLLFSLKDKNVVHSASMNATNLITDAVGKCDLATAADTSLVGTHSAASPVTIRSPTRMATISDDVFVYVLIADPGSKRVTSLKLNGGVVELFAGAGSATVFADGPRTAVTLNTPNAITPYNKVVYVTITSEAATRAVRISRTSGVASKYVSSGSQMYDLKLYKGQVYFTLETTHAIMMYQSFVSPTSSVALVGTPATEGSTDTTMKAPQYLNLQCRRKSLYFAQSSMVRAYKFDTRTIESVLGALSNTEVISSSSTFSSSKFSVGSIGAIAVTSDNILFAADTGLNSIVAVGLPVLSQALAMFGEPQCMGATTTLSTLSYAYPAVNKVKIWSGPGITGGSTCPTNNAPTIKNGHLSPHGMVLNTLSGQVIWSEPPNHVVLTAKPGIISSAITAVVGSCTATSVATEGTQTAGTIIKIQTPGGNVFAIENGAAQIFVGEVSTSTVVRVVLSTSVVSRYAGGGSGSYVSNVVATSAVLVSVTTIESYKSLLFLPGAVSYTAVRISRASLIVSTFIPLTVSGTARATINQIRAWKGKFFFLESTFDGILMGQIVDGTKRFVVYSVTGTFTTPNFFMMRCVTKELFIADATRIQKYSITAKTVTALLGSTVVTDPVMSNPDTEYTPTSVRLGMMSYPVYISDNHYLIPAMASNQIVSMTMTTTDGAESACFSALTRTRTKSKPRTVSRTYAIPHELPNNAFVYVGNGIVPPTCTAVGQLPSAAVGVNAPDSVAMNPLNNDTFWTEYGSHVLMKAPGHHLGRISIVAGACGIAGNTNGVFPNSRMNRPTRMHYGLLAGNIPALFIVDRTTALLRAFNLVSQELTLYAGGGATFTTNTAKTSTSLPNLWNVFKDDVVYVVLRSAQGLIVRINTLTEMASTFIQLTNPQSVAVYRKQIFFTVDTIGLQYVTVGAPSRIVTMTLATQPPPSVTDVTVDCVRRL